MRMQPLDKRRVAAPVQKLYRLLGTKLAHLDEIVEAERYERDVTQIVVRLANIHDLGDIRHAHAIFQFDYRYFIIARAYP